MKYLTKHNFFSLIISMVFNKDALVKHNYLKSLMIII